MPIDGFPPDALNTQLAAEERTKSSIQCFAAQMAGVLPDPVGGFLATFVARDRDEKQQLTVDVLKDVVRRQEDQIQQLWGAHSDLRDFVQREWPGLFIDGLKKAGQTRARERVRRIAMILGSALLHVPPTPSDEVEEMLRVAMELSDTEVLVLREFVRIEGQFVKNERGRIPRYEAHSRWTQGNWRSLGVTEGELQSICSKLEGLGLVMRLAPPNNLNILADFESRYALLPKGMSFVEFIGSEAAFSGT